MTRAGAGPRPNLFVIGAQKAGTTSLHMYLSAHPRVFMCDPKEPNFFIEELNWRRGLDWYLRLFAEAGDAAVIGESSNGYTKLPTYRGVASRIHAFDPEARLIYLMRDPVDRIVSQYWHNVRTLRDEGERRGMLAAVRGDPRYVAYSDYAMQLEPYLELFGRERILLLTFERLAAAPAETVAGVCRWLGLGDSSPPADFTARWNARPLESRSVAGWGLLNRFRHTAAWRAVRELVPISLRDRALGLAERRIRIPAEPDPAVLDYLRPILRDRVGALGRLVQLSFPEWTTLHGTQETPSG